MNWTPRVAWTNAHSKDGACRAAKVMWIDGAVYAEVWKGKCWGRRDADGEGKSDLDGKNKKDNEGRTRLNAQTVPGVPPPSSREHPSNAERNPPNIGTGQTLSRHDRIRGWNAEDRDRMEIYGEAEDESKSREALKRESPNAARHDVQNPE
ncbi:hypothetical protein FB45DRAFT_868842 [Roridomyces roridus]|uniref:Uncharacterized protein n=1 Tax=Roridomyces roridus TaxID=1738132 RepID=A0AAD7BMU2_9AGAR|nr:hypothetical protein FB45DRAFT_868842 [Roridomyces roridus]